MNHLKGVASILPPIIITISSVSLMSGSQPRLPPGELSNMKPKSAKAQKAVRPGGLFLEEKDLSHHGPYYPNNRSRGAGGEEAGPCQVTAEALLAFTVTKSVVCHSRSQLSEAWRPPLH